MESGRFSSREEARKYVESIYFSNQNHPKKKKTSDLIKGLIKGSESDSESNEDEEFKRRKKLYRKSGLIMQKESDEALEFKKRNKIFYKF
jgi:hypothetical protein